MKRKKLWLVFMAAILSVIMFNSNVKEAKAADIAKKQQAFAAYQTLLSRDTIPWGDDIAYTSDLQFTYTDINNDGIDELILRNPYSKYDDGDFRIYTLYNNKAKSLGKLGNIIEVSNNKNWFSSVYTVEVETENYYYKLEKGKKKPIVSYKTTQKKHKIEGKKYVRKYSDNQNAYIYFYDFTLNGKKTTYKKCMDKVNALYKKNKMFDMFDYFQQNESEFYWIDGDSLENVSKYNGYTFCTAYTYYDEGYPNVYRVSSKGAIKMLQYDAHILKRRYQYLYTEDNAGDFGPTNLYVINGNTSKIRLLTKKSNGTLYTTKKNVYYPVFSKYKSGSYKFKIYRCKLDGTNKKVLTKTISAKKIVKYNSTYVQYKKGDAQYRYYYKNNKVKKVR